MDKVRVIIVTLLILMSFEPVICQTQKKKLSSSEKKQLRLKAIRESKIFTKNETSFDNTMVPEKWANESAVVLAKKVKYNYINDKRKVKFEQILRNRVKLLDKAAVEEFSEFYFMATEEVGVRIIKPDGTIINVDTEDAVEVHNTMEVPSFFKDLNEDYSKLAVPGLEENDIIDYYYRFTDSYPNNTEHSFEAVLYTLSSQYPVIQQKVEFDVQFRGFYINFNSYNNGPELAIKKDDSKRVTNYSFVDSERDKLPDIGWFYKFRNLPYVKFQVVYSSKSLNRNSPNFLGEIGEPKTKVTTSEMVDKAYNTYSEYDGLEYILGQIKQWVNSNNRGKNLSTKKYIRDSYYYIRHYGLTSGGYDKVSYSINEEYFIQLMAALLNKKNIPFEIGMTVPRFRGELDNVLIADELIYFLRVRFGKEYAYIFTPDLYSNYNDIMYSVEGAEALVFDLERNSKNRDPKRINMPVSKSTDNYVNKVVNVSLNDDLTLLEIEKHTSVSGHNKYNYFSDVLIYDDFVPQEYKKFGKNEFSVTRHKAKSAEIKRKIKDRKAEESNVRMKEMEKSLKADYEVESYDDFELIKTGRQHNDSEIVYSEKYTIKDLVKKAGPNYIIEIGKLIGGQIELEEEDMERSYQIDMAYARSYKYEVKFTLPEGYIIEGIDNLNMEFINETGGFNSKSQLLEGVLTVTSEKHYNHYNEQVENWPKMVEFLEAAYDFTQQKILLKKKSN